jgi:lambda repressor-like predicted transcriptional regulator
MTTKTKSPKPAKAAVPIPKDQLAAIVKRLESGASTLFAESQKAGLTPNTPLRVALREHLGGKAAYERMIAKGMQARTPKAAGNGKKSK